MFLKILIYHKYFLIRSVINFSIKVIFLSFFLLPFISLADNSCINYLAVIGDMEHELNSKLLGSSISVYKSDNLKINYFFDYTNKTNGNASFKIIIDRNGVLSTNSNNLQILYFSFDKRLILPILEANSLISAYRDYYPRSGDKLKISFDFKTNTLSSNLIYTIKGSMRDLMNNSFEFSIINNTSNAILNWTNFNYSTTVINNINYEGINPFYLVVYAKFPNINTSSQAIFWLDNIKISVERFNSSTNNYECVKLPPKNYNSSLKFVEVFTSALPYTYDWINYYVNFDMYDEVAINTIVNPLRVYYYDNNFKITDYLLPTELEFRELEVDSFRFKRTENLGGINFDDINQIINNFPTTTWWSNNRKFKFMPNIGYPEFYLISKISSDTDKILTSYYRILNNLREVHKTISAKSFEYVDFYNKYTFSNYAKNKNNKNYYWAIRLDSPNTNISGSSPVNHGYDGSLSTARYFTLINTYKGIAEKLKFTGKKIFANFGYRAYFDESYRYFGFDKFLDGFMNEGFLINRNLTFKSPQQSHYEIQSVVENFKNKYSILMSYTNKSWCTSSNPITNYLVSSFYLVNNPGVYISFEMPLSDLNQIGISEVDSRSFICQVSSLYLPLGNPEQIENINQMIIASTSNFINGALYRRRYERGLVLLNTSTNTIFIYRLSSTSEPFFVYKDQLGNIYDFSNNYFDLQVLPQQGVILYNDFNIIQREIYFDNLR
ncbi:MAG: hypothetical protein KatS3mg095_0814 [Candidatus Parcubacteria bacterium]|nr:MAG: hypothetical protein KatS3mg095_0814 [Candidatus Parcubacteria bacterium]